MGAQNIRIVAIADLVPHEQFREDHKEEIKSAISGDGALKRPIAVYELGKYGKEGKYMIIDGHHRTQSLRELGCVRIAVNEMDYFDDSIKVHAWSEDRDWDKDEIVRRALDGELMAPKSTRHVIAAPDGEKVFQDNDTVEPESMYPLDTLR